MKIKYVSIASLLCASLLFVACGQKKARLSDKGFAKEDSEASLNILTPPKRPITVTPIDNTKAPSNFDGDLVDENNGLYIIGDQNNNPILSSEFVIPPMTRVIFLVDGQNRFVWANTFDTSVRLRFTTEDVIAIAWQSLYDGSNSGGKTPPICNANGDNTPIRDTPANPPRDNPSNGNGKYPVKDMTNGNVNGINSNFNLGGTDRISYSSWKYVCELRQSEVGMINTVVYEDTVIKQIIEMYPAKKLKDNDCATMMLNVIANDSPEKVKNAIARIGLSDSELSDLVSRIGSATLVSHFYNTGYKAFAKTVMLRAAKSVMAQRSLLLVMNSSENEMAILAAKGLRNHQTEVVYNQLVNRLKRLNQSQNNSNFNFFSSVVNTIDSFNNNALQRAVDSIQKEKRFTGRYKDYLISKNVIPHKNSK